MNWGEWRISRLARTFSASPTANPESNERKKVKTPIRKAIAIAAFVVAFGTTAGSAPAAVTSSGLCPGECGPMPMTSAVASFYGKGMFSTASGMRLRSESRLFVAHKSLPFGTRIHFMRNGVSVVGVVRDRGPFVAGRTFDVSYKIAAKLGLTSVGVGKVRYRVIG